MNEDAKVEEFLEHFGIKGMKWGVRRGTMSGKIKPRTTLSLIDRLENNFIETADTVGYTRVYRKAARKIRGMTRQLNNDPKYKGQDFKKDTPLRREYYKEYADMVTKQLNAAVQTRLFWRPYRKAGQSITRKFELHFASFDVDKELRPTAVVRRTPSRKAKLQAFKDSKLDRKIQGYSGPLSTTVKHADEVDEEELLFPEEGVTVSFEVDETGHILDLIFPGEELLAQSMDWIDQFIEEEKANEALEDDALAHWGVLGMKWGVRRADRSGGTSTNVGSAKKKLKTNQVELLSDEVLKSRIARIKMEQEYAALTAPKKSFGKRFVDNVIVKGTESIALSIFIKEGTKFGSKLVADILERPSAADSVASTFKTKSKVSDFFKDRASSQFESSPKYNHSDFVKARTERPYNGSNVTILLPGDPRRFKGIGMK